MKSLVLKSAAALLFAASTGTIFAQSVTKPGQIAVAPEAVLSTRVAPISASALNPKISIPSFEERHDRKVNRIWLASMLAMGAATGMDAASSWGKHEGNSFLASSDGTFGAKGLSIKAGVAAGVLLPQVLFRRHKDLKSKFAIGNFAEAALFGGVAIHNLGVPAAK